MNKQTFYFSSGINYSNGNIGTEIVLTGNDNKSRTFLGSSSSITTTDNDFKGLIITLPEGAKIGNFKVNLIPLDKIELKDRVLCEVSLQTALAPSTEYFKFKNVMIAYVILEPGNLEGRFFETTVDEIKEVDKYLIIVFEPGSSYYTRDLYGCITGSFDILN